MGIRFWTENRKLITKLFVNQIGMTIFGLVLAMAASMAQQQVILLWVSVFAICFYLCLIYSVMWEEGAKDAIRVNQGRKNKDMSFPLKASTWAALPNFVAAVLMLFAFLFGWCFASFGWAQSFYTVLHLIVGMFQAMYTGLFKVILAAVPVGNKTLYAGVGVLLYFLSSLPMMLMSVFAYWMGFHNKRIFATRTPSAEKKTK